MIPGVTVTVIRAVIRLVIRAVITGDEKCVNKRWGGISPTLYAVQHTRTDLHNSRFIVYDNFRSCIVRIV